MSSGERISLTLVAAIVGVVGFVPTAGADTAKVVADNFDFSPKKVKIKKNDRVKWKNAGGNHTVTMSSGGQNLDEGLSGDRTVKSDKFKKKGEFSYVCSFHKDEGMRGKVIVK